MLLSIECLSWAHAQVSVTTYHYDLARTGQNTQERILTPANVNSTGFGKVYSLPLDGAVYAQPLYLYGINIGGGTHNVLYIATEHDSIYAIDADNATVFAQASLIPSGGTSANSVSDLNCTDVVPEMGITGTPVIDTSTGTLYVVAVSKVKGAVVQYLHALSVTTFAEKFGGPVQITASVPGTGIDANGGVVTFNATEENQRAALTLTNGHVLIGWSAHCDHSPWHGWLMSYNATTLAQEAVFNTSPNGSYNGVWMAGGGPAVDANGNIYVPTGQGTWNGSTDYGDSIVKLGQPAKGAFPVLDYFTPYNQATLNANDQDVGSGGLVLLPALANGTKLLAHQGKGGTIVLLNTANLGKYCVNSTPACTNNDPQIVQEIQSASPGIWGSPAYWNGNLYWTGAYDPVKAYSFNANNSGLISTTPTSQSAQSFAFSAPTPTVSSNGTSNGILWALDGAADDSTCQGGGSNCLGLFAYDATNLAKLLYISSQAANNRDSPGVAVKFEHPIVANGKVFVGAAGGVTAYGLLTGALPAAAAPTFSPAPGSYQTTINVTLSASGTIYYTTDGSSPVVSTSELYTGPIPVSGNTTIRAIAIQGGYTTSSVASGVYSANTNTSNVSLSSVANVDAIVSDGSAVPNGGLDGAGYAYSSNLLGSSLNWNGNIYTFGGAGKADAASNTTVPLPAGNYTTLTLLGTGVNGNHPNQTFTVKYSDGTSTNFVQSMSDWWTPQSYAGETQALAMPYLVTPNGSLQYGTFYLYGYSFALNPAKTAVSLVLPNTRNVVVLAVDVAKTAAAPTFSPAPGAYNTAQSVSLSSTTSGASIYYTTNGTTPTTSSTLFSPSSPIQVNSSMTIKAIAAATGYSNSPVSSGTYTIKSEVSLSTAANVVGIVSNGSVVPSGGLDGGGYAYSANLLGSSINWNGNTYAFGSAGAADAVSNTTVPLPAGNYTTLTLLGTGVNGSHPNQTFTVNYSDGTSTNFVQSMSDWWTPQSYAGETQVLAMSYIVSQNGSLQYGTFSLYGYSFALNSAKTAVSLVLPSTRNVVVLAIDISTSSATPQAAAPTFSPAPGTYSTAQSVSLASTTAGASIYYTTNGTTPTTSSTLFSPSSPIQVNSSMTIKAIAAAPGYTNSSVSSGTYTINSGTSATEVSLSSVANVDGIVSNGSAPPNGGLDGAGYAYSANLLGSSLNWNGNTYAFGSAGTADAVSNTTVPLPAGNYTTLTLLGTGVNGSHPSQTFIVKYSDGTSTNFVQSMSDWWSPQSYAGETQVSAMPYLVTPNGSLQYGTFSLYGYSFALNSAKTAVSLVLPNTRNVVVLAVDVH